MLSRYGKLRLKSASFAFFLGLLLLIASVPALASDDKQVDFSQVATATPSANIQFSGEISNISIDRLIVNGLVVLVDVANLPFVPQIGMTIYIEGVLQADGSVRATVVQLPLNSTPSAIPTMPPLSTVSPTPDLPATGTLSATPSATATNTPGTDDDDDDPIIVIEGPVEAININIITIYDIDIIVNVNDPILNVIQIGDFIRVEGIFDNDDDSDNDDDDDGGLIVIGDDIDSVTIVIIAVNITFVDIDIFINDDDGQIWRDEADDCANPPPPWAPAHGWRRRCEGGDGNPGNNPGRGRNNDDDNDDDDD